MSRDSQETRAQSERQEAAIALGEQGPGRARRLWSAFRRDDAVWAIAALTLFNGILGVLSVLLIRAAHEPRLFDLPLPYGLYHWGRNLTLLFSFALIYLSLHLWRRKKAAWTLALIGSILAALAHLWRGHHVYTALGPAFTAVLLVLWRRRYTVRSEADSIRLGITLFAVSLLVALAYGTLGFWLLERRDFGLDFRLGDALLRTIREFTLVGNSDLRPHTAHARWFLDSFHVLGVVSGAVALYSLFRPVAYRLYSLPQQRDSVRHLLEEYGGTALDYFKLSPDMSYYFSEDKRSCIAYRTSLSVAISLGDPVGPPEGMEAIIRSFLCYCQDNGWAVVFHEVLPDWLPIYHRLGLQSFKLGQEATVDLDRLVTETARGRHFRHTLNKFDKEGYRVERFTPPHRPDLLDQVESVSRNWLTLPGHHERSFTLGSFRRDYMNQCPLFVVLDPTGQAIAFANEIPSYRPGEATIDLMRHRVDAPNGTMDYLFLKLMMDFKERGYRLFDLGLAPFAGVGGDPADPLPERLMHQLSERSNKVFSYRGIHDYKAKFDPLWEERFLVHQGGTPGLIKSALAILRLTER